MTITDAVEAALSGEMPDDIKLYVEWARGHAAIEAAVLSQMADAFPIAAQLTDANSNYTRALTDDLP